MSKTIILLSAKRCGSTAVFQMFQKHPDVGVCHVNQEIENWEPNFWNYAARAISGDTEPFIETFTKSHPFLKIPQNFSDQKVFEMWDQVLHGLGPIIFDKSPKYLGSRKAMDLLLKYKNLGNDVRIFAFIRDPRDAISSQFENWHHVVQDDSPKKREYLWLDMYSHLEELQEIFGFIPIFRYEDFSKAPSCYAPIIFDYCGLPNYPNTYQHINPVNIGRYHSSRNAHIRKWAIGDNFSEHLKKYGYLSENIITKRSWFGRFKIIYSSIFGKSTVQF